MMDGCRLQAALLRMQAYGYRAQACLVWMRGKGGGEGGGDGSQTTERRELI
jgi:hypothetical protein